MLEYYRFTEIHALILQGRVEEARLQLAALQGRYVELCDENAVLRTQVQGFEDILFLSRNLIFDGIFFWLVTGSIKQGPFCPSCYNREGLLLRLTDTELSRHCLTCGSRFDRASRLAGRTTAQGADARRHGEEELCAVNGTIPQRGRKATIIPFGK